MPSGRFAGRGYFPLILTTWDRRVKSYGRYVAPIAKAGFYTLTSAASAGNQAAETANRSGGTFFPFMRTDFGSVIIANTICGTEAWKNHAPEQLSYIDIGVGKWPTSNTWLPSTLLGAHPERARFPADGLAAGSHLWQRLWRYRFEGLLVIPNTPLIVGLSANVSAQHPSFPEPLTFLRQTTCASSLDSASMPADWPEF